MIRYYSYYNCGGYKDMYIGADNLGVDARYFVPLLPIWEANESENKEKIERAMAVPHIELLTNTMPHGFPKECNVLFSRGGYDAIYKTLSNGTACFCIKDISNDNRDEENRETPFNFLFIAEGAESVKKLDNLAVCYLNDSERIENEINDSISYDPIINAIKFDLTKLETLFNNDLSAEINHIPGKVIYIKANNPKIALKELNINPDNVNAFYDENNNCIKGENYISKNNTTTIETPKTDITEITSNDFQNKVIVKEQNQNNEDVAENLQNEQSDKEKQNNVLSKPNVSLDEIVAIKDQLKDIQKNIDEKFAKIEFLIGDINKNQFNWSYFNKLSQKKLFIYFIIFIIGIVLGILL